MSPPSNQLSPATEDYLKAIYKLEGEQPVSTQALAEEMDVTPASATNMVKRLANQGLVQYEPYRGTMLSAAGRLVALEVIRHHRLLELYLKEIGH